jgi:hypothetical protein
MGTKQVSGGLRSNRFKKEDVFIHPTKLNQTSHQLDITLKEMYE